MQLRPWSTANAARRAATPRPGDVWLSADRPDGAHFQLREFANPEGLAVVRSDMLRALEALRAELCAQYGEEVFIRITCGTRTRADQVRLAQRLGWADEGGLVARSSRHLPEYGGIAVDIYARTRSGRDVPQAELAAAARKWFLYVKADYSDGHVHCDMRS